MRYAVMIPSRGRSDILRRHFKKSPELNNSDVYVGVELEEKPSYERFFQEYPYVVPVFYPNQKHSIGYARQRLIDHVLKHAPGQYSHAVLMDDNSKIYPGGLDRLVQCAREWPVQPVIVAGMSRVSMMFDRKKIAEADVVNGIRSYESVSMMVTCVPMNLLKEYRFPDDMYALEDRHFLMWCMERGVTEFRICADCLFNKPRYQRGGQGSIEDRALKCGWSIQRLAKDFPYYVGANGTIRIPWTLLLAMKRGATPHRLGMGSTKSDQHLVRKATKKVFKIRKGARG